MLQRYGLHYDRSTKSCRNSLLSSREVALRSGLGSVSHVCEIRAVPDHLSLVHFLAMPCATKGGVPGLCYVWSKYRPLPDYAFGSKAQDSQTGDADPGRKPKEQTAPYRHGVIGNLPFGRRPRLKYAIARVKPNARFEQR